MALEKAAMWACFAQSYALFVVLPLSGKIRYIKKKKNYHTRIQNKKNHEAAIIIMMLRRSVSVGTHYTVRFTLQHPPNSRNFFHHGMSRGSSPSAPKIWAGNCQRRGQSMHVAALPPHGKSHLSGHICTISGTPPQEWARSLQSGDWGLLTSSPLEEAGKSPGAQPSP